MRSSRPEPEPALAAEAVGHAHAGSSPPVIPDYEVLKRIGSGAYGDVWLVRNLLGTWRAAKVVYRRSFERDEPFERELKGIQRFEPVSNLHESQVKIFHIGRNDRAGYFYYVMELADDAAENSKFEIRNPKQVQTDGNGENPKAALPHSSPPPLRDLVAYVPRTLKLELKRRGRLPFEECLNIGLSLATALEHLHAHGLLHRDVKPSNIIFVNGRPKLADIGLVTDVEATRSFVGTEGFIPPEGPGTVQADLYSLGKVLYEMSMGRSRLDFPALPANWDDLPAEEQQRLLELNEVLVKACEGDPCRRYRSGEQMRAELSLLEGGQSVRRRRALQRRWVAVKRLALVACAAALVYPGVLLLRPARHGHIPRREVLDIYKLGQWYYYKCTGKDHAKAFNYLTQATQMDPQFPQPYGELILLYGWSDVPGVTTDRQRLEAAREIVKKLKAIDPNLAQTHVALSFCHFLERDWRGAEREIVAAIKADPNLALAHFTHCYYLGLEGRTAEAEREGKQAQALDPPEAARVSAIAAAWPFIAERRFDLAIAQLKQALELDQDFGIGHLYLGNCYDAQSNYVAAIEEYRTDALHSNQDNEAKARVNEIFDALRQAYDTGGQQAYLRKWIELVRANAALPKEQQSQALDERDRDIAGYYAQLGEKEKALDELEKHFDEPNAWSQIKFEPLYQSLHGEPRYQALVKRAGLKP